MARIVVLQDGQQASRNQAYRTCMDYKRPNRLEEVVLYRLRIGQIRLTHSNIMIQLHKPTCLTCNNNLTILLIACRLRNQLATWRQKYTHMTSTTLMKSSSIPNTHMYNLTTRIRVNFTHITKIRLFLCTHKYYIKNNQWKVKTQEMIETETCSIGQVYNTTKINKKQFLPCSCHRSCEVN